MILRLTIERSREPQGRAEMRLADGLLTIGRGAECDWQLMDSEQLVSRKHCVVSGRAGQFSVTDESSGGLYLDGSDRPLGQGRTVAVTDGLRLQLGDIVIRAALEGAAAAAVPAPPQNGGFFADDFFTAQKAAEPPPPPPPADLPKPFEDRASGGAWAVDEGKPVQKPHFDDPFALDLRRTPHPETPPPRQAAPDFDFGGFDTPPREPAREVIRPIPERSPDPAPAADLWAGFDLPPVVADPPPARHAPVVEAVAPPPPPDPAPTPVARHTAPPDAATPDPDALAALLRGLGISPPPGFTGTAEEFEALGKRFRMLAEGLVGLLRARAQEKGASRVAQTVIGASAVNPLKFLPTTDEALAALIAPRGPGYLPPEAAIAGAFQDLHDHRHRSWTALQSSLRRMIDRFDPALFEAEVEDQGLMKALVSGSRSARLWQNYAERYRDIAKAAEDRFLGEVGADFRDAYEQDKRNQDD